METWIVMIVLALILLIVLKTVLMKVKFFNHRFSFMITLIIIAFLVTGLFLAISGHDVDLSSGEGIKTAFKLYAGWFGNSLDNLQGITSNAIKMDWGANSTSAG